MFARTWFMRADYNAAAAAGRRQAGRAGGGGGGRPPVARTPGFSIVRVEDDIAKGFRARFMYAQSKNTIFLQYSQQLRPRVATSGKGGDDDGHDQQQQSSNNNNTNNNKNLFGRPLVVNLPLSVAVRMLSTLEAPGETTAITSRQASGTFEPDSADEYSFRLALKASGTVPSDVPSEFNFVIDAGHAVVLHRFLRLAFTKMMGFDEDTHGSR